MCLFVDDMDALHARMVEKGFTSRAGRVVTIADGPHKGAKVAYLIDPDGYHVECYQPVVDIVAQLNSAAAARA
jgi:hypothetical protein